MSLLPHILLNEPAIFHHLGRWVEVSWEQGINLCKMVIPPSYIGSSQLPIHLAGKISRGGNRDD